MSVVVVVLNECSSFLHKEKTKQTKILAWSRREIFCAFFKGLITMRTKVKPLATQDTARNFLVVEGNLHHV